VPDILDSAFHTAFFIAAGGSAGASGKVVVSGEFQKAGVEVNGIAAALQHHAAEVIGLLWRSPFCVRMKRRALQD
jgi:hypothetical protein